MASEATITPELVFKAADELAAGGRRPTIELVRALLAEWTTTKGGSFATLAPLLRQWKERNKAASSEVPKEAPPQLIADKLQGWSAEVWALAVELAHSRLAADREVVEKIRAELEADEAEAQARTDRLDAENDALRKRCTELDDSLGEHRKLVGVAEAGKADAEKKALVAEQRASEIQRRADDLNAELSALRADLTEERAKRDGAEDARRAVESRLAESAAELARSSQQIEDLTARLAAAEAAHAREIDRLTAAHKEALHEQKQRSLDAIDRLTKANQRLEAEAREHVAAARAAAERAGRVEGEVEVLRTTTAAQAETIRRISGDQAGENGPPTGGGAKGRR